MKKFAMFGVLPALFLLVLVGCQQSSDTKGSGEKLTLEKPSNVTINRGETATVKVKIKRNNYADAVKVAFEDLPEGVTVDTKEMTIAKDKTDGEFTLKADKEAKKVENHEAKVVVTGEGGLKPPPQTFKITVKDKS